MMEGAAELLLLHVRGTSGESSSERNREQHTVAMATV